MAITILDDLPEFLKNFLIRRGIKPPVDPNAVPVSSGLVPALPRRRVVPENAYTSGDIDVDPPADIPFDPSYFSNLLGGLFGGSENTSSIPSDKIAFPNALTIGSGLPMIESKNQGSVKNYIAKTQNDLTFEKDRSGKTPVDRFFGGFDYLDNEYLSDTQKNIATVGKIVPSIMGGLAPVLGLFGAIGQAMGAHHPLNFNKDSNVFMDPVSGTSIWDSLSDGGGGAQVGVLNLDNQIASAANNPESQGQYVKTPYGYITIGNLNNAIKSGLFDSNAIDVGLNTGSGLIQDAGFIQDTPVSFQDFSPGFTNQQALQHFDAINAGPLLNFAGEMLGPDAGYDETRDLAEAAAEGLQNAMGMENISFVGIPDEDDVFEDMINADFTDGALDVDLGSYFGEGDYGDGLI